MHPIESQHSVVADRRKAADATAAVASTMRSALLPDEQSRHPPSLASARATSTVAHVTRFAPPASSLDLTTKRAALHVRLVSRITHARPAVAHRGEILVRGTFRYSTDMIVETSSAESFEDRTPRSQSIRYAAGGMCSMCTCNYCSAAERRGGVVRLV